MKELNYVQNTDSYPRPVNKLHMIGNRPRSPRNLTRNRVNPLRIQQDPQLVHVSLRHTLKIALSELNRRHDRSTVGQIGEDCLQLVVHLRTECVVVHENQLGPEDHLLVGRVEEVPFD